MRQAIVASWCCFIALSGAARADDVSPAIDVIRAAVTKALPPIAKGAAGAMAERARCYTCHSCGLPVFAMAAAKSHGFAVDEAELKKQTKFTIDFLAKGKEKYRSGEGTGGQIATAGYALWTLDETGWQPDETTAAVVEYLLLYKQDTGEYRMSSQRPPTQSSRFTAAYLALRGLQHYGTAEQQERIAKRSEKVKEWLLANQAEETEDAVFRLRTLAIVGAGDDEIAKAKQALLAEQRADGGWSQLKDLESDAYATGTALVALAQDGALSTDDPAYRRGLKFLLDKQLPDGTWHVKTRSPPIQIYFESGFPHAQDQFISIAASSWATIALSMACPPQEKAVEKSAERSVQPASSYASRSKGLSK